MEDDTEDDTEHEAAEEENNVNIQDNGNGN